MIWKWIRRCGTALLSACVLLYVADLAIYKLRGSPQGSVSVSRTITVPLKGNKKEVDYLGSSNEPCSVSLFSQDGVPACWRLRRTRNQNTAM